jgi:hypothetical protein
MGGIMKREDVVKAKREARESMIKKTLGLIHGGCDNIFDLSSKMGASDSAVRLYVRVLMDCGCIESSKRPVQRRAGQALGYTFHYVAEYNGQPVESEPMLPFDPALSRMMGYTDIKPLSGSVFKNLDKPHKSPPLRKINTAWMGYQSGFELA